MYIAAKAHVSLRACVTKGVNDDVYVRQFEK